MSTAFDKLLPVLVNAKVEFILIGGVAGIVHGSSRVTYDVDVVYARNSANLTRLTEALAPYTPYLRGAPTGLPFKLDLPTLRNGLNFTLSTDIGDLDLLAEVPGGPGYSDLLPHTFAVDAFEVQFKCVDLPSNNASDALF
jgi:hypothetical protein